jgi:hypothetical protein
MEPSMNFRHGFACVSLATAIMAGSVAVADTITVYGTDDIFLAGQTTIPTFPGGAGELPPSISVAPGETLTLTATGLVSCCSGTPVNGPDGMTGPTNISGYGNVLGYLSGEEMALVGVYDGPGAPGTESWQVFKIGSSATLVVPNGVTTLYLASPTLLDSTTCPASTQTTPAASASRRLQAAYRQSPNPPHGP